MKNKIVRLFILVLVTFHSSCTHDFIEYPDSIKKILRLSNEEMSIAQNSVGVIDILSGVGGYKVVSKDKEIAEVKIVGEKIHIKALKIGDTDIVITDKGTNYKKTVTVSINKINFDATVKVEGGKYIFGTKEITLESFWIGKYEVTTKEFCEFLNNNTRFKFNKNNKGELKTVDFSNIESKIENKMIVYTPIVGKDNLPIVSVNWATSKEYCEWKGGRLPSETEWEYAAQGGNQGPGNGNEEMTNDFIDTIAWWGNNVPESWGQRWGMLHKVQTKKPNKLGIHNMLGNVTEWCQDYFQYYEEYKYIQTDGSAYDPIPPSNENYNYNYRVTRGGSTTHEFQIVKNNIHSTRHGFLGHYSHGYIGIRVVFDVAPVTL